MQIGVFSANSASPCPGRVPRVCAEGAFDPFLVWKGGSHHESTPRPSQGPPPTSPPSDRTQAPRNPQQVTSLCNARPYCISAFRPVACLYTARHQEGVADERPREVTILGTAGLLGRGGG